MKNGYLLVLVLVVSFATRSLKILPKSRKRCRSGASTPATSLPSAPRRTIPSLSLHPLGPLSSAASKRSVFADR